MTRPTPRTTSARLPRSARRRLDRSESTTARTSLLTVPAAFGVRATGLEAIGDVMGCVAVQTTFEYVGRCGTRSNSSQPAVSFAYSGAATSSSFQRQLSAGYRTALERMRAEASALSADGVLGVRLELTRHEDLREFVAMGTAVRSTGRLHTGRVFTTDLPGQDVAKLMLGGWTPVELHVALLIGLRHVDQRTMNEANPAVRRGNREVSGYTDLRQQVTRRAGENLRSQAARSGGDGALLSALRFESWHRHCSSMVNSSDLVGMATATGTSVARFAAPSRTGPSSLTILPLGKGL